jgi:hypothetical protein
MLEPGGSGQVGEKTWPQAGHVTWPVKVGTRSSDRH